MTSWCSVPVREEHLEHLQNVLVTLRREDCHAKLKSANSWDTW